MIIRISEKQLKHIVEQAIPSKQQNSDYFTKFNLANKAVDYAPPFTPENFAKHVVELNIVHPEIAIAQAMIESGHFKSNLFQKNNNVFGMKFPRQRSTTASGSRYGQAFYKNWVDSVKDYKLWQDARKLQNLSKEEYLSKLDKIYCMPPHCAANNYSKHVQSLISRANQLLAKANMS